MKQLDFESATVQKKIQHKRSVAQQMEAAQQAQQESAKRARVFEARRQETRQARGHPPHAPALAPTPLTLARAAPLGERARHCRAMARPVRAPRPLGRRRCGSRTLWPAWRMPSRTRAR